MQSVGLIPKHLPFSGSSSAIVHFRHALSLDEHRVKFVPFFWTGEKHSAGTTDTAVASGHHDPARDHRKMERRRRERSEATFVNGADVHPTTGPETDVEEVFFAGAHCGKYSPTFLYPKDSLFTIFLSRRRRWVREKWYTSQPRPHSPSMDD